MPDLFADKTPVQAFAAGYRNPPNRKVVALFERSRLVTDFRGPAYSALAEGAPLFQVPSIDVVLLHYGSGDTTSAARCIRALGYCKIVRVISCAAAMIFQAFRLCGFGARPRPQLLRLPPRRCLFSEESLNACASFVGFPGICQLTNGELQRIFGWCCHHLCNQAL